MPKKPAPKDARKRTKKPRKIADLPVKSLKGKDAAAVKGGITIGTTAVKMDTTTLKIGSTALKLQTDTTVKY